jgi:hypothetical protein
MASSLGDVVSPTAFALSRTGATLTVSMNSPDYRFLDSLLKATGIPEKQLPFVGCTYGKFASITSGIGSGIGSGSSSSHGRCVKSEEKPDGTSADTPEEKRCLELKFIDEDLCKQWTESTETSISNGTLTYIILAKSVGAVMSGLRPMDESDKSDKSDKADTLEKSNKPGFSIDGIGFNDARIMMGKNRNALRILKDAFLGAGRANDIPEGERKVATQLAEMASALPFLSEVRTIDEWKKDLKAEKVDNRDVKLALGLVNLPWVTTNNKKKLDTSTPHLSSEGTYFCIVRKEELTQDALSKYARKMTCVHTPRRKTQEEATADRTALLECLDVALCLQGLNSGRTSFQGCLGPNLRLEDGCFAARYDGEDGERRIRFNLRDEAERAAIALNEVGLSAAEKDKLADSIQVTVSVIIHGQATTSFSPVILIIDTCGSSGARATTRVRGELNKIAAANGISLMWRDIRDECKCPPGYCLPITPKNGDDVKTVDAKIESILAEFPESPVILTNRGIPHNLKNRHLAEMSKRPYWAVAYQPCNYNQRDIGLAMSIFLSSIRIPVSPAELHAWSSEASASQTAKRFKLSDEHRLQRQLLGGDASCDADGAAYGTTEDAPPVSTFPSLKCSEDGCEARARLRGSTCKKHGGGVRCSEDGCLTAAVEGFTASKCRLHGGGRRCAEAGCTTAAAGSTDRCIRHGGGNRCVVEGCFMSAVDSVMCKCIRHKGEQLCMEQADAPKVAEKRFCDGASKTLQGLGAPHLGAPALGAPAIGAPALGAPHLGAPHLGAPALGAEKRRCSGKHIHDETTPYAQYKDNLCWRCFTCRYPDLARLKIRKEHMVIAELQCRCSSVFKKAEVLQSTSDRVIDCHGDSLSSPKMLLHFCTHAVVIEVDEEEDEEVSWYGQDDRMNAISADLKVPLTLLRIRVDFPNPCFSFKRWNGESTLTVEKDSFERLMTRASLIMSIMSEQPDEAANGNGEDCHLKKVVMSVDGGYPE